MRARNIKPSIFINEDFAFSDPLNFVIFAGLWCYADRDGRFEYRPEKIHLAINPGRDLATTQAVLGWLLGKGFIRVYDIDGKTYADIPGFEKHQKPHIKEKNSIIPAYYKKHDLGEGSPQPRQGQALSDSGFLIPDSGLLIEDRPNPGFSFNPGFPSQLSQDLRNAFSDVFGEQKSIPQFTRSVHWETYEKNTDKRSIDAWIALIEKCKASRWLQFQAHFDLLWFTAPGNSEHIENGRYDDARSNYKPPEVHDDDIPF